MASRAVIPILRPRKRFFDFVISGSSNALTGLLPQANKAFQGKSLAIVGGHHWAKQVHPEVARYQRMGQSYTNLTHSRTPSDSHPKVMTIEQHAKDQQDALSQAIWNSGTDMEGFDTPVVRVGRLPDCLCVTMLDGTDVFTRRYIHAAGVGPERTMMTAGMRLLNSVSSERVSKLEVDTAVSSLSKPLRQYRGKTVVVYGGGATGAWVAENYHLAGADVYWITIDNFNGADPTGINSYFINHFSKTGRMMTSKVVACEYTIGGLEITCEWHGIPYVIRADKVIAALGQDPLAPMGLRSILGDLYPELRAESGTLGVYGVNPKQDILVAGSAAAIIANAEPLLRTKVYPRLEKESRVAAGLKISTWSGMDVADLLNKIRDY